MTLRHNVNFVTLTRPLWPPLEAGAIEAIDDRVIATYAVEAFSNWILRTYVHMAQAGYPVTLSSRPRTDSINVAHGRDVGKRVRGIMPFLVITRADSSRPMLANFWIAQNGLHGSSAHHGWVPHWPQAGIVPRDPDRGGRIARIVYKGRRINLDPAFREQAFVDALAALDVELSIDDVHSGDGTADWHDYRDADLTLAVRNLTTSDASIKPASKLVNAWIADVPAVLGPEPAFQELRRSAEDYIEVRTPTDVLDAVRHLRAHPTLHAAMIANGRQRRRDFTTEALLARWVALLDGPVADAFEAWQRRGTLARTLRFAGACVAETVAKRYYLYAIRNGRRILDMS